MYKIRRHHAPLTNPHATLLQVLTASGSFETEMDAENPLSFYTVGHAVATWNAVCTRFHELEPGAWIEGPHGGRYDPITGHPIRKVTRRPC